MKITYDYYSENGKRPANEDCVGLCQTKKGYAFAVADGMGTMPYGALASKVAMETFLQMSQKEDASASFTHMVYELADRMIFRTKQVEKLENQKLWTTMASLQFDFEKEAFFVGHIGDARVYVFRKNELFFQTKDHSKARFLLERGEITPEEYSECEQRHHLTRVLGTAGEREKKAPIKCEATESYALMEDMAFLLCTDGFWSAITIEDITECLKKAKHAGHWLAMMYELVKQKEANNISFDNHTALTVMVSCE